MTLGQSFSETVSLSWDSAHPGTKLFVVSGCQCSCTLPWTLVGDPFSAESHKISQKWNYLWKGSPKNIAHGKLSTPQKTMVREENLFLNCDFLNKSTISSVHLALHLWVHLYFISRDWKVDCRVTSEYIWYQFEDWIKYGTTVEPCSYVCKKKCDWKKHTTQGH